jgi:hypothetical protein
MEYSQERIQFKHYGKYVARMIRELRNEPNREATAVAIDSLARYMRSKSFEYNQEHPNNEVIIKDIKLLSEGGIEIDEVALNNLRSDYKHTFTARPQKGQQQRPQLRGGGKNLGQKQHANQKMRPNSAPRKNAGEGQQRYNSQR